MGEKEGLIQTLPLEEYFCERVRTALAKEKIQASLHTEYYLVRMLSEFSSRRGVLPAAEGEDVPLALVYLNSFHAGKMERIRLLKCLADFALYFSGFFQDNLVQKQVDVGYYVSLGGTAYYRLGAMTDNAGPRGAFSETFVDLSENFRRYMDVLSEISESSGTPKNSDLLKLYEKWIVTGSERLARKLSEFGILPHSIPKKETLQ